MSNKYIFLMGFLLINWKNITRNHNLIGKKAMIAAVEQPKPQPTVTPPKNPPKKPA